MYQASVPVFIRYLNNLSGILKKAEAFAESKEIEPEVLFNCRLAPDMFPLSRQVQIATDLARRCVTRLAGEEPASVEDKEKTFADFQDRIRNTVKNLETLKPEQIDGSEENNITLELRGNTVTFTGMHYLLYFTLPNFYFHITTAYDILRHNGVELGKLDFTGVPKGMKK